MVRTQGTSPKAKLAAAFPTLAALLAVGIQWLVTGELDRAELVTALTGLGTALLAFAGAWLGSPGAVLVDVASDSLLSPEADARLSAD